MEIECFYTDPPHIHSYPDDWIMGGASGLDPRADPRFRPTTYEYYNEGLVLIHTTQVPLCDDQAIDEFTLVAEFGPRYNPVWLTARRPDGKLVMLDWVYDKTTDVVTPRG